MAFGKTRVREPSRKRAVTELQVEFKNEKIQLFYMTKYN